MVSDKAIGLLQAAHEGVRLLKDSIDGIEKEYKHELQELREKHAEIVLQLQCQELHEAGDTVPKERPPDELAISAKQDFIHSGLSKQTTNSSSQLRKSDSDELEQQVSCGKTCSLLELDSISSLSLNGGQRPNDVKELPEDDFIPTETDPINDGSIAFRRAMQLIASKDARTSGCQGDDIVASVWANVISPDDYFGSDCSVPVTQASLHGAPLADETDFAPFPSVEMCKIWEEKGRHRRGAIKTGLTNPVDAMMSSNSSTTNKSSFRFTPSSLSMMRKAWICRLPGLFELCSRMVSHPNGRKRLIWDFFGMFLIFYDLVTVPMLPFDPDRTSFTTIMSWVATVYWTVDIPCSFFVGFHQKGLLEMRLRAIARRYVRTWLAFDVMVVSVDWSVTLLTQITESSADRGDNVTAMGRLGRLGRFLRAFRLLRLLKLRNMISELFDRIHNEAAQIVSRILGLIVFIVIVNHLLACGFYGMAEWNPGNDASTWISYNNLEDTTFGYRYFTSLHWSLTQFTPASMEIFPRNTAERIYNVLTLLFAMVTFSSFVGSITNAMTRLRNLDSEELQNASQLRKYLNQNKVSEDLSNNIWSWLTDSKDSGEARLHEPVVKAIAGLPRRLRSELHEEIYGKLLKLHPFFKMFAEYHGPAMPKIYSCLKETALNMGQELFASDDNAKHMYFMLSGTMTYLRQWHINGFRGSQTLATQGFARSSTQASEAKKPRHTAFTAKSHSAHTLASFERSIETDGDGVVCESEWICEQVLWIRWQHCGILLAKTHTELFKIEARLFQELCQKELVDTPEPARYARLFARYIRQDRIELTDVWCDRKAIEDLTVHAFFNDDPESRDISPCSTPLGTDGRTSQERHGGSFRSGISSTLEAKKPSCHMANMSKRVSISEDGHSYYPPSLKNASTHSFTVSMASCKPEVVENGTSKRPSSASKGSAHRSHCSNSSLSPIVGR